MKINDFYSNKEVFVTIKIDEYIVDAKKALTPEKRQNPIRDDSHETFNVYLCCLAKNTQYTKFLQLT